MSNKVDSFNCQLCESDDATSSAPPRIPRRAAIASMALAQEKGRRALNGAPSEHDAGEAPSGPPGPQRREAARQSRWPLFAAFTAR